MAYIGQEPVNTFSPVPTKDTFTGDGSTTTFDLQNAVVNGGENALEVFVNNVRQEPGSGKAFTLGPDGSNEIKRIMGEVERKEGVELVAAPFKKTDHVKVISGPFLDFSGSVEVINEDKQKVKVIVSIFGRPTSIELDFFQVELEK